MVEALHKAQTIAEGLHSAISFEYADEAERLAAGPFQDYDLYKLAFQLDGYSVWVLVDVANEIWVRVQGSGPEADGYYLPRDGSLPMLGDLNLDSNSITTVDSVFFNLQNPDVVPWEEGRLFYDVENHSLALYNDQSAITQQLGQEQFLRIFNNTGSTIIDGQAVYLTGAQGNRPTVALAKADSDATSHAIGLATHDIPNNSEGFITTFGVVSGYNTSLFFSNDMLWVSPSVSGGLTNVKPTGTDIVWTVGRALNSTVNGKVLVAISPPSMIGDMHDVNYDGPVDGYYLRGDGLVWNGSYFDNDVLAVIAASGSLDLNNSNIINSGLINGVDIEAHASRHQAGGEDALDGYNLDMPYSPISYTPQEATIGGHIAAIDGVLASFTTQLVGLKPFSTIQINSDYVVNNADFLILVDTSNGNVTVTLPDASSVTNGGHFVISKNVDVFGSVIVTTAGGLVAGDISINFSVFTDSVTIYSDGTDYILS